MNFSRRIVTPVAVTKAEPASILLYLAIKNRLVISINTKTADSQGSPKVTPCATSLVQLYGGEEADYYLGGEADNGGTWRALDIGLQMGHTGNYGYAPFDNDEINRSTAPDSNPMDQIKADQGISMIFEAPGCPDPAGVPRVAGGPPLVPDGEGWLIIKGQSSTVYVSPNHGATETDYVTRNRVNSQTYVFENLNGAWSYPNAHINVKYTNSIAQRNTSVNYNAPTNYNDRTVNTLVHAPFFYTSGSYAPIPKWRKVSAHPWHTASSPWAALARITPEQSAGSPYVAGTLNTVAP